MRIRRIDTDQRKDVRKFIEFPFDLYRNHPGWVPTLDSEMRLVLNKRKHPFFLHSPGDFFIVESEGQVIGRIAVLKNNNYCSHHGENVAFHYYLDTIDDLQVSNLLFSAYRDWALANECDQLYGPRGFTRASGIGCLVEGFEYRAAVGIPYNFEYYSKHYDHFGFQKTTDYYSTYLDASFQQPEKVRLIAQKVAEKGNFKVINFRSKSELRPWVKEIEKVHEDAFKNNPGYYPSTPEEFELQAKSIIQIADPKLIKIIMAGDEPAGFIISYPDVAAAFQRTGGKLFPFGWIDILHEMRTADVISMNGVGLLPKYQGLGANVLLYTELEKVLRARPGLSTAELIQVDERNHRSLSDMESLGVKWVKTHRTYQLCVVGV
ncbi:MAG: GNAT family N-acetyltransferase [Anaerolineae bacterium]|nr:GNAT family N-acetyltransferase [Anaerolineae bacterium]